MDMDKRKSHPGIAGRKPLPPEQRRASLINFRATAAEKASLEEAARERGKTVTAVLTEALRLVLHGGRAWARCSTPGCKKRATERGLCHTCYMRERARAIRAAAKEDNKSKHNSIESAPEKE